MADESEDLSPAELDAQIGPGAEIAAARQPASADLMADIPAVDDLSELSPEQQAIVQASGAELPATEPTFIAETPGAASVLNKNGQWTYVPQSPLVPTIAPAQNMGLTPEQEAALAKYYSSAKPAPSQVPQTTPQEEPVAQQVAQAATPSFEEAQSALSSSMAPVRQLVAESEAKKQADAEIASYIQKEQDNQVKINNQISAMDAADRDYVRARSFGDIMKNGNFGSRILAGLAVLMGGVSQGLSGAAKNPVLEYIDSEADRQAQKDKLSFEQRLQLRSQLLDSAKNVISAAQNRYQNQHTQEQLQLEYDKINGELLKIQQKMQASYKNTAAAAFLSGVQTETGIPVQGAPEEQQRILSRNAKIDQALQIMAQTNPVQHQRMIEKLVTFPNGQKEITSASVESVKTFNGKRADNEAALKMLSDIKDLAQNGSKLDPRDRAAVESRLIALSGKLRESLLGPGAMTQQEYDRLTQAIGNPSKLTSLEVLQMPRLNAIADTLEADLAIQSKTLLNKAWTPSKRAQVIINLRNSGKNPRQAAEIADKLFNQGR